MRTMEHVLEHIVKRAGCAQTAQRNRVNAGIGEQPVRELYTVDVHAEIAPEGTVDNSVDLRVEETHKVFSGVTVTLSGFGSGDFGMVKLEFQRLAVLVEQIELVLYRLELRFGEARAVAEKILTTVVDTILIVRQLWDLRVGPLRDKTRQFVFALVKV